MLRAYRTQGAAASATPERPDGIRRLEVAGPPGDLARLTVTVELAQAQLGAVVRRLLDAAQAAYVLPDEAVLEAEVTARLEAVPLPMVLALLGREAGLEVVCRGATLVLRAGDGATPEGCPGEPARPPAAPPRPASGGGTGGQPSTGGWGQWGGAPAAGGWGQGGAPAPAGPTTARALSLRYLESEGAARLLRESGQTGPGQGPGGAGITVVSSAAANRLVLQGPPAAVARATALLRQLDRPPSHVFLEALVLEMATNLLIQLGTDLQRAGFGELADLATGFGTSSALTFRYLHGTHNRTTLTTLVNLLVSTERARVVSRPFVSTMSAQPARIEIAEERYVITQQANAGSTVTGSQPVQAGISIGLTPVVGRDERIRLAVKIEDSEFSDAAIPNVSVAKVKSTAETTMVVASGQSVVIGGLTLSRRSESLAGLPWLRHVPGLSLLAAKQGESDTKMEVLVIVTAHVWRPGMGLPVPLPESFRPREGVQRPRFFEEELPRWPAP